MGKFVLLFKGGAMAETPEAQEASMARWMEWFGVIGGSIIEMGNPFSASTAVGASATSNMTGYTVVSADSLDAAAALAGDCPILADGGAVEVYEAHEM